MNFKKIVPIFIAVTVIAVLAVDVWLLAKGGTEATISHWMIVSSYQYPLIPFFWGFLMGHFFWRLRDTKDTGKLGH